MSSGGYEVVQFSSQSFYRLCRRGYMKLFSSVQSFDRLGRRGDIRDDSAEIFFQSYLQKALMSSSDLGRNVQSLISSIQYFLCRPRRRPFSEVP